MSMDPVRGVVGDMAVRWNPYMYVGGNPIMRTDPSGQFFLAPLFTAAAGAIVGAITGYIMASAQAEVTYQLASSGHCGCDYQQQLAGVSFAEYAKEFRYMGVVFGATIGALIGAGGPAALLAEGAGVVMQAVGAAQTLDTMWQIFLDFKADFKIDNLCLLTDLAFDISDILIGKAIENLGNRRSGRNIPESSPAPTKPKPSFKDMMTPEEAMRYNDYWNDSYTSRPHIWSPTKKRTPAQNAWRHWTDHGSEFPEYSRAVEYVKGAHDFIDNPPRGTLFQAGRSGDTIMYHPQSNTLSIYTSGSLGMIVAIY